MIQLIWLISLIILFSSHVTFAGPTEESHVDLHSIQADFVQEKHLKILARPIVSTGTFTFQAPQSLRWEYKSPIPSILIMHDGGVKKYIEKDGQFVEDRGMQVTAMQFVLAEISNWLDGRFSDNDMFSVSGPDDGIVLLSPKEKALSALINRIELKLADQQGLLDSVKIIEGPDSFTLMTFGNRSINREIPSSEFTVQ